MPYITCDDGKTYSRYNSSTYVKDCIAKARGGAVATNVVNCNSEEVCHTRQPESFIDPEGAAVSIILLFTFTLLGVLMYMGFSPLLDDTENKTQK